MGTPPLNLGHDLGVGWSQAWPQIWGHSLRGVALIVLNIGFSCLRFLFSYLNFYLYRFLRNDYPYHIYLLIYGNYLMVQNIIMCQAIIIIFYFFSQVCLPKRAPSPKPIHLDDMKSENEWCPHMLCHKRPHLEHRSHVQIKTSCPLMHLSRICGPTSWSPCNL